jgi:hypothetical protein
MFSTFITVALFVSLAIQGASATFAINTPTLNQCTPGKISWAAAVAPYTIEVVSADDPCGAALQTIDGLTSTIYQYTTSLKPGTQVMLFIADSAGNEAWSGDITIGGSSDTTCTPGPSTITASTTNSTTPNTLNTPADVSPNQGSSSSTDVSINQSSSSSNPSPTPGLGGAINAEPTTSGVLTVHGASTLLLTIMALAATLALTL